jgi:hypothetical protein
LQMTVYLFDIPQTVKPTTPPGYFSINSLN